MSNRTKLTIIVVVVLILIYGFFVFDIPYKNTVDDFATCAKAGRPIMESFPRQCTDTKGVTYTEEVMIGTSTTDKIFMDSPEPGSKISSPVKITGQARGPWFFEASFPIEIISADGTVLGQGIAQTKSADGSWMTEAFVPWKASVKFDSGLNINGFIRLKKDNPSGDSARDEHLDIPINF